MRVRSVYVHFPYCLAKCPYCDFVSYATERSAIDHAAYADAVIAELGRRTVAMGEHGASSRIESVFFGGGTPSLWDSTELGRVLRAIGDALPVASDVEVTVECNPTSLDGERARALAAQGVTRLSVGTQSLRADQLAYLGRLHDAAGARRAVSEALAVGGLRVSTDLIFGLPDQSPEDAADQARELAELGLAHLSCYQLTIEPRTLFGERARRGLLPLASDSVVAEAFVAIEETLTAHGLAHYEISNYARPGDECRHNLSYWLGRGYLGLGCGAVGLVRAGEGDDALFAVRYRNEPDPARYRAGALTTRRDRIGAEDGLSVEHERLDGETLLRERIMLGLRLESGLDLAEARRELGVEPWSAARQRTAARLAANGRLERDGDRLVIRGRARLFTDDTAAQLF